MFKIQARAAIVLGKIGDPQAIPVLEDLAATTTNQFTRRYVRAAIDEIANKDRPQRSRK
jgi:HEAT repeat protein